MKKNWDCALQLGVMHIKQHMFPNKIIVIFLLSIQCFHFLYFLSHIGTSLHTLVSCLGTYMCRGQSQIIFETNSSSEWIRRIKVQHFVFFLQSKQFFHWKESHGVQIIFRIYIGCKIKHVWIHLKIIIRNSLQYGVFKMKTNNFSIEMHNEWGILELWSRIS